MQIINIPKGGGTADSVELVANVGSLPSAATVVIGSVRVAADTGNMYVSDGTTWNLLGGGGGAVASVNGLLGVVTLQVGDGTIGSTATNLLAYSNGSAELSNLTGWGVDPTYFGLTVGITQNVIDDGYHNWNYKNLILDPSIASPSATWAHSAMQVTVDPDSTGFDIGTNGTAVILQPMNISHNGTSDTGSIQFVTMGGNIGNGTDPITTEGLFGLSFFPSVSNGATIDGQINGYNFSPTFAAGSVHGSTSFTQAFSDFANYSNSSIRGYASFVASPSIDEIQNNANYTGLSINPTVNLFNGNAGLNGISVTPSMGGMGYGAAFQGVIVNPQTSSVYSAYGIYTSLDNVTTDPGSVATLTEQDLTFTTNEVGEDKNTITIEYVGGGTAGSEVVSNIGLDFTVQIENGVSTATQIKAALDASNPWGVNITTTVSGTGSDPQTTFGPTNLAGGLWAGEKWAGYFDGDVNITGSLSFSGGLSIGALNSFGPYTLVSGTGTPQSVSTLITAPTVAANQTITSGDLLAVNTAMLLQVGDNSTITTDFLGLTALGLPAVVGLGIGATVDRVGGAAFAVSLDAGATGGTLGLLSLCRALALPNGVTTVTRSYGYEYDMPFGIVGTTAFGLYIGQNVNNWIEGSLRIGGTTISADTTPYDFHVDGDSFFDGDIGFFGTVPVAQQASSGPATAGGTYTATEQAMLQEVYNALRAYGLLS